MDLKFIRIFLGVMSLYGSAWGDSPSEANDGYGPPSTLVSTTNDGYASPKVPAQTPETNDGYQTPPPQQVSSETARIDALEKKTEREEQQTAKDRDAIIDLQEAESFQSQADAAQKQKNQDEQLAEDAQTQANALIPSSSDGNNQPQSVSSETADGYAAPSATSQTVCKKKHVWSRHKICTEAPSPDAPQDGALKTENDPEENDPEDNDPEESDAGVDCVPKKHFWSRSPHCSNAKSSVGILGHMQALWAKRQEAAQDIGQIEADCPQKKKAHFWSRNATQCIQNAEKSAEKVAKEEIEGQSYDGANTESDGKSQDASTSDDGSADQPTMGDDGSADQPTMGDDGGENQSGDGTNTYDDGSYNNNGTPDDGSGSSADFTNPNGYDSSQQGGGGYDPSQQGGYDPSLQQGMAPSQMPLQDPSSQVQQVDPYQQQAVTPSASDSSDTTHNPPDAQEQRGADANTDGSTDESTVDHGDDDSDEAQIDENGPMGEAPVDPLAGKDWINATNDGTTLTHARVPKSQSFWGLQPKDDTTANVSAWLGVNQNDISSPLSSSTLGKDTSFNAYPLTRQPLGYEEEGMSPFIILQRRPYRI